MSVTPPVPAAPPDDVPYKFDLEKCRQMFAAVGAGRPLESEELRLELELEALTYEINRLKTLSEWYSKLETNGKALESQLQSQDKDMVAPLNDWQKKYITEGVRLSTQAGKPPSSEQQEIIRKVLNGEKISREEAQKLYSWVVGVSSTVVPTDMQIDTISNQIKQLEDQYHKKADNFAAMYDLYRIN